MTHLRIITIWNVFLQSVQHTVFPKHLLWHVLTVCIISSICIKKTWKHDFDHIKYESCFCSQHNFLTVFPKHLRQQCFDISYHIIFSFICVKTEKNEKLDFDHIMYFYLLLCTIIFCTIITLRYLKLYSLTYRHKCLNCIVQSLVSTSSKCVGEVFLTCILLELNRNAFISYVVVEYSCLGMCV